MSGKLYICPTPIGNLEDITYRTLRILKEADIIAAEDTRHTVRLLNHFEISKPLTSCHEYNEAKKADSILDKIVEGQNVALVSDAGMPGISDPGHEVIKRAIERGIDFEVLPGASAFTVALVGSGLPTDGFQFVGFLDRDSKKRKEKLSELVMEKNTLIFYESPHRILKMLQDVLKVFGARRIAIARELTKKYEEFIRTDVAGAIEILKQREIKGEFVIVVEGLNEDNCGLSEVVADKMKSDGETDSLSDRDYVKKLMDDGMTKKDAIKKACKERKKAKNEIYQQVLDL